ncbi:MAG: sulfatase-like hydrolase/transferase, partial [Pseudomonadales bacterium]
LGRLVASLKARGLYENTIFIFTSDNGPEMRGPANPHGVIASRMATNLGYDQSYERLGERGSYNSISPSFASAAASPFAYYKFHVGEGGMRVPLIITNVPGQDRGAVVEAFSWATDIAPTLLAAAGVSPPEGRFGGRPVLPMSGKNLLPVLGGEASAAYGADESIGYELTGHGVLFQGDYKARRHAPPVGEGRWALYNIVQDPGETKDLSAKEPERLARMIAAYEAFEASHGVQPLPAGYSQVGQLVSNMFMARLREPLLTVLLTALVLLAAAGWLRRGRSA